MGRDRTNTMLRIFATILLVATVASADEECDKVKSRLGGAVRQCAEECGEEMGGRPEDVPKLVYFAEQQACPDFCVLDHAGLLDDEGRPNDRHQGGLQGHSPGAECRRK